MSDKYFLDTNVLIYSFDENDANKAKRASELIRQALATNNGVVSYQVVQEFFSFALRKAADPMTTREAEGYLYQVLRPLLSIHSSPVLFAEALHLHARYQLAWYDSLIVAAAIQARCDLLYSEDLQSGQRFGRLQVKNPFV
ncbi:MAG: PIN domain-containing protein [Silvibacterium sp.]|nr:PIN domain-containing protein [Silvibacterium sp.]MBV8438722.1 PIN domain-containing protein [Silvibacterium sp.]